MLSDGSPDPSPTVTLKGVPNMITMTSVVRTPILGTRLWIGLGGASVSPVYLAPKPRRTRAGVDFHNSTGVSAWAERLLR
ncbi:MAG: hypothetical protein AVDCRST_MAG66-4480 [uncultured Pseudonocardia sp.]|uniref:Uncharacterized protein n=1 Tax=uncultured Pseudonocardia sp. TaxID=211455 RepID=A0A6J4QK41_9PSEU|nr:MAG: hypothetical protein AVDCRST_MAG66-4480 [uncultured Pseudonocardia sp.]